MFNISPVYLWAAVLDEIKLVTNINNCVVFLREEEARGLYN